MFSNFFSLENRKTNTKYIIDTISEWMLTLTGKENNKVAASIFILFHMNIVSILLYNLFVNDVTIFFYFLTFCWIILISSNYYFRGCILARIERELLQDETWAGPINITLYPIHLFYRPNKQILNDYIKYFWAAPISTFIILKYIFDDDTTNKLIGIALTGIFLPLLFIHSQYDIFSCLAL
jgi:hypothetical protein